MLVVDMEKFVSPESGIYCSNYLASIFYFCFLISLHVTFLSILLHLKSPVYLKPPLTCTFCLCWPPENWFFVDEKEPVAHVLVEVFEASDVKPSDLNG